MFFIKKFNNSINLQKDAENLNPICDKIIIINLYDFVIANI